MARLRKSIPFDSAAVSEDGGKTWYWRTVSRTGVLYWHWTTPRIINLAVSTEANGPWTGLVCMTTLRDAAYYAEGWTAGLGATTIPDHGEPA